MALRKTDLLCLLALLICTVGCIKESLDDCPKYGYSLVFFYPGNGTIDIFPEKIDHVNMFIYDSGGNLLESPVLQRGELEAFQGVRPELPDGNYIIVCWGNVAAYSQVTDTDPVADGRLYQPQFLAGQTIEDFDSLYFGRRNITIDNSVSHTDTLRFVSAHINMQVHIEGYQGRITTRASGQGIVEIENISVGYDFGMNLTPQQSVMFPLWETDETDTEITSVFNLLRFENENDIIINIRNSDNGQVIGSVVLSDFLEEYGIDVEGINEVTVPIYIIFDEFGMRVSVEPWNTTPILPVP